MLLWVTQCHEQIFLFLAFCKQQERIKKLCPTTTNERITTQNCEDKTNQKLLPRNVWVVVGCGAVGRAVTSNIRDPRFESRHQQFLWKNYENFLSSLARYQRVSLDSWPPVLFVWIHMLCLCWRNNRFTCLVKSKSVKQPVHLCLPLKSN